MIGIVMEPLSVVDHVALYLEGESCLFLFPAPYLREIHERHRLQGDARYTGDFEQQWRIDLRVADAALSPQGSDGKRYDIRAYRIQVGDVRRTTFGAN
ncbi:MAG: hypothetical protein ACFCVE_05005 [Phycisphaerae bacterium]